MKKLLASTAVMLSLVGPAFAQDSAGFMNAPAKGDIYASNLMGMRLYVTEKDVTDEMMAELKTRCRQTGTTLAK